LSNALLNNKKINPMKKQNVMKRAILTLGFIICCGAMFVSCTEEEVTPGYEKTQLLDDVVDVVGGDSNDGNSNADGPRGKDHDVIDIDIL
jgi:hypothetical protein